MVKYIPEQKDIIYLDFTPQSGYEQMGRRPALVLSNKDFNNQTKLALVCPITSNMKEYPLHIKLNNTKKIKGVVMCEQMKTLDFIARNAEFKEKITDDNYNNIINVIKSFIDID